VAAVSVTRSRIPDVLVIEPRVFADERGVFFESWSDERFRRETGVDVAFVQDNYSSSRRGVLRGLHYQVDRPQGKLVWVSRGSVFDVVVDLRRGSATFGQWVGHELSESNRLQLWVPPGFAHGFFVLSDEVDVLYKATDTYSPGGERTLRWDDPALSISWPVPAGMAPVLSAKDRAGALLCDAETFA
jgi:dTDP-4-dehydrorhamnose 3,5-epimerase